MLRRIIISLLFLVSFKLHALVVEPFLGAQVLTRDAGDTSSLSLAYGGQIGVLLKRVVLSAEYQSSDINTSTTTGTVTYNLQSYGIVATFPMSPATKIYARYVPYFKFGETSYNKGTGFGVGFGYRLVRRLFVNFDYTSLSASEYVTTSGSSTSTASYGKFLVSLSLPLNF